MVSDEEGKVSHLPPLGSRLGNGVKYTLLGAFVSLFLQTFFSTRTGRTARQPNRRAH